MDFVEDGEGVREGGRRVGVAEGEGVGVAGKGRVHRFPVEASLLRSWTHPPS